MSNAHPGRIVPQDILPQDGSANSLTALPFSQAEIEELLYGDDRPAQERIQRLQELAAEMRAEEPADYGDGDPRGLLLEIDEAIARLSGDADRDPDMVGDQVSVDDDPLNHRETLSPDSDELEEIEEKDEASVANGDEVMDPEEWDDGDGFDSDRGVK